MDIDAESLEAVLRVWRRPPAPLDDPATPLVLFERAKLAGFSEGQAATLATYLSTENELAVCRLPAPSSRKAHLISDRATRNFPTSRDAR